MRIRTVGALAATITAAVGALFAVTAPTASAGPVDCAYTVSLPKTVTITKAVVGLTATLTARTTSGAACAAEFSASTHLVHGTDDYLLMWDNSAPTKDTQSVYAFEVVPGTYSTAAGTCYAASADLMTTYTCSISAASTVVKFGSTTKLVLSRAKKAPTLLTFTARSTHFSAFGATSQSATVSIQRYSGGKWHTIHTAKTNAKTGAYTWTHKYPKKAKYRATSAETGAAWTSTSKTVSR